jgi:hypothetical protein
MTGGSALMALTREGARLAADDLHGQVPVPRPVQLGRDDGLELAEDELALADREGQRVAEEAGLEVRVGVVTVAVGQGGIVVLPGVAGADHLLQHGLDVVQQRRLPFVHEQRHGGVQRGEQHHALLDVVAAQHVRHALGQVVELETLVRGQADRLGDDADGLRPSGLLRVCRRRASGRSFHSGSR